MYHLKATQSIAVKADLHRCWSNTRKENLELLVIKTPEEI